MAAKSLNSIWIRRQQCPCGDWKCYIRYEGGDNQLSDLLKTESTVVSSSSPVVVFTPYVGQIFKTDDEALDYYSRFARKNGFSIRKARSTESQNLGVYRRDFVCCRSGFNQQRKKANVEHPRERKSVRCGCDAKLYLTKEIIDGGLTQWYVSQFSNVHNHELLEDDQVRLLPAYRKIHEVDQQRILLLSKAGFPVNRIVKVMELEKGVQPGQLHFIEKDVRNFVRTCKKTVQENDALLNEKRETDLMELVKCCKVASREDDGFSYSFTTDENGKVDNIAWAYGTSVRAFPVFGDVVTFDTSYCSITYNMLLGVWFGIDNFGKPIILGCALLQDESSHSFSWAIQVFVRFMRGKRPQTIVTDIDTLLRDAISIEMPSTKHVMSIWQVISKVSSWFSSPLGLQYAEFKSEFDMLCHFENTQDFEIQWNRMVARFGLGTDKHMAILFSYRSFWSYCYIRDFFLGRTMSLEYSKSLEMFLKNILGLDTSLLFFFKQVSNFASEEQEQAMMYMPTKTCLPLEEHARTVLTPYAFGAIQHELVLSMQYEITEMSSNGNGSYLVRHYKKMEGECLVLWIPEDEQVHCSCKEFEHSGILCRHSLRLLVVKNYFRIPEKYFLVRWRLESSMDEQIIIENKKDEYSHDLHNVTSTLFSESFISKERFSYVRRELIQLLEHVRNIPVVDEVSLNFARNNFDES